MSYEFFTNYINENINKSSDEIYDELKKYDNKEILNFIMLDRFNYIPKLNETLEERLKRQDTLYRKKVIEKYNTCMISGKDIEVCQVAHILPFKNSNEEEKYDSENGFLLSADLHMLFDNKNFDLKINQDGYVIFSDNILKNKNMIEYNKYNNKKINLTEKNKYYLKKKYGL